MGVFDYRLSEKVRDALKLNGVRYLFIGKSGAILLGSPDTTQGADIFVDRSPENGRGLVTALRELKFELTEEQAAEIEHGKTFIQLKNGPFDLNLIFAPDGIERFDDAWSRHVDVEGFPFVIPTTSSPAKPPRTGRATANRCLD